MHRCDCFWWHVIGEQGVLFIFELTKKKKQKLTNLQWFGGFDTRSKQTFF